MKRFRIQEYFTIEPAGEREVGFEKRSRYVIQIQKRFLFFKWWTQYYHKRESHWEGETQVINKWYHDIYKLDLAKKYLKLLKESHR